MKLFSWKKQQQQKIQKPVYSKQSISWIAIVHEALVTQFSGFSNILSKGALQQRCITKKNSITTKNLFPFICLYISCMSLLLENIVINQPHIWQKTKKKKTMREKCNGDGGDDDGGGKSS